MGLTFDQLFPGRFIKAGEMHGKPVTLTIKSVYLDNLEGDDGREQQQGVITFEEIAREWALNKTNGLCLRAMFGSDTDGWLHKRITLYPEPDTTGMSESGVCLRVQGSPDIEKTVIIDLKLPRRKAVKRKLQKTVAGKGATPAFDAVTGEVAENKERTDYAHMDYPEGLLDDDSAGGFDGLGDPR